MNSSGKFSYFFRKYSFVRVLVVIAAIAVILGTIFVINYRTKPAPVIDAILPPVGAPGDVVIINGKNFGDIRDMSYVEIAGSRLTASSYISWSDTCIKLVLPASVQDGLVFVGTKDMRSKPALFANEVEIPVPVPETVQFTKPVIYSVSPNKAKVGEVVTITGANFGESRNQSRVFFNIDYNKKLSSTDYLSTADYEKNIVSVNEFENGYEYWSNSEIKVVVPDGAYSGYIYVDSGKEKSDTAEITIDKASGKKEILSEKIYLFQYTADISDVVTTDVSTITLRCPVPFITPAQPSVEITEVSPAPILQNYQNCLIHQITKNRNNLPKSVFKQTFVVPVYEIKTEINSSEIGSYKKMNEEWFTALTSEDKLIPSDKEDVVALSRKITGKEKNAYNKAKLIYNYMLETYTLLEKVRNEDGSPLDLLTTGIGDAYDMTVIFTALCRASGIPCLMDSGVLVNQDLLTQAHWWSEFYLPDFGWVPVDVALGADLNYKKWLDSTDDAKAYYFGNLDAHRILFSRGLNNMKPFAQDNKIVQYPRSFALQNIWEEASNTTAKYSSFWSLPVIKGVY